ncbi:MAG: YidC/Oxa1 family membrane protein insertase [Candidatus Wolfebacteria bacterium]|nr:YidC/Oxa1 family membrane protein insertase [Candidatus Wolfebacteria bacterium]
MGNLFNQALYYPLWNALVLVYQYVSFHDLGIAIIVLTILIRVILAPLFYKGARDQAIIQRLSPKIKEIQREHKHDKEKQAKAMMDLYKEHKVNPFSGFLLLLVQLPVLIALYKVFLNGFKDGALDNLYSFVPHLQTFNHYFLGIVDLSSKSLVIVLLAALAQYYQSKLTLPPSNPDSKDASPAESMARNMLYMGPIFTIIFLYVFNLPSAVALYWLTTSAFSVIQQIVINKNISIAKEIKEEIKKEELK